MDYVDRFVALLPRLQDHWGTNAIKRHSGILAMGATNNFIGANFILGQASRFKASTEALDAVLTPSRSGKP